MLTGRPLNKPSRALVARGSLLECPFFRAGRFPSRYTHRVAIANSRRIAVDEEGVTFKWKDNASTAATDTST
jgi:hypothetical protein